MKPLSDSDDALLRLLNACEVETFRRGDIIIDAMQRRSPRIYLIDSGYVRAGNMKDGEERTYSIYGTGAVFPATTLVDATFVRSVNFVALSTVKVHTCKSAIVRAQADKDLCVAKAVSRQLSLHCLTMVDRVGSLEFTRGYERLAYQLLYLGAHFGKQRQGKLVLEPIFTHQLIASMINLSRESVTREFDKLRRKGFVEYHDRQIVMLDAEGMSQELDCPVSADFWGLITKK